MRRKIMDVRRAVAYSVLMLLGLNVIWMLLNPMSPLGQWVRFGQRVERNNCQTVLSQIRVGMAEYCEDNGGRFPPAGPSVHPDSGWASTIQVDLKCTACLHCIADTTDPVQSNPGQRGFTSYWFNQNLSEVAVSGLYDKPSLLVLGDGGDGSDLTNSNYSISGFSRKWLTDPSEPTYRHFGGANYLFADGHVRWLKPAELSGLGSPRFKP